jgi:hypothetical protein
MNIMKTRSFLILTAILVFGVLVTMGLVSQSTSIKKSIGLGFRLWEKSDFLPAAGEKFDPSEIRQALSELLALEEGVGSNQQILEKKAALKAAVESGIKNGPKSVLKLLFDFEQVDNMVSGPNAIKVKSFIQRDPELAITLLNQVPNEFGRSVLAQGIGFEWAESDLKAALAWANQQTDPKIKSAILEGVISSWGKTDLKGALAYVETLPPGVLLDRDRTISEIFEKNSARGYQGALAMMQSLPEGRDKDLATKGISDFMSLNHPRAAWDLASGIGDSRLRGRAEFRVEIQLSMGSLTDPDAATQWMQSLPVGDTKDRLSAVISRSMAQDHPLAAFDIAAGIGDSNLRTRSIELFLMRVAPKVFTEVFIVLVLVVILLLVIIKLRKTWWSSGPRKTPPPRPSGSRVPPSPGGEGSAVTTLRPLDQRTHSRYL